MIQKILKKLLWNYKQKIVEIKLINKIIEVKHNEYCS